MGQGGGISGFVSDVICSSAPSLAFNFYLPTDIFSVQRQLHEIRCLQPYYFVD